MSLLKIVLVLAAAVLSVDAVCDTVGLTACTANYTTKYPGWQDFTGYQESNIDEVCKDYKTLSDCVTPKVQDCDITALASWQAIDGIVKFMCSDKSKKVLKDKAKCLEDNQADLQKDVTACTKTYTDESSSKTGDELCTALQTLVGCAADAAKKQCGDEVGVWLKEFMGVTFSHLTADITGCDITKTPNGSGMNVYSLVFLMMPVLLGFIIKN